ncbi:MAG: T9SS type A sorting domain-containing protein [Sphingobacteriales bacterium]|nr:MAG: T9SS type A sorting domain-containing protein [Sphingobacteriales bacterium]
MKKITLLALATGLCLSAVTPVFANRNLWSALDSKTAPTITPRVHLPSNYSIVKLDQEGIKALLQKAGTSVATAVELSLPTHEGTFKTFKVWQTPVMEDELQANYPEIRTYTGTMVGDGSQTIKITNSPYGLVARSFSFNMNDVFAIESYGHDANGYYTVAAAGDYYRLPMQGCNPNSLTGTEPVILDQESGKIVQRVIGEVRRTYRFAVACTGDYARAVSGTPNPTVSQVLAIITATVNNANGVWEREMSVSTKLVNNNTAVIYLDPTTDPYANDAAKDVVIDENQTNHTTFIGNANYDLGHVLTAAGGGLAALASVCSNGSKASGVSGSSGPTDIGTLTHEVGHQLGAGHTFTSKAGGCDGNGMPESSYEPGSGTTIMSYNGACATDNTPMNTTPLTDYYNQFNLGQMRAVITTSGACGSTQLGQTPVNINPINPNTRYIIPANTPFELIANEATNTVATNSTPTYCWEQFDLGPIDMVEANGSTVTQGPVFSSLTPVTDRSRVMPMYATLKDGLYTKVGERTPNVNRTMKFTVTARSVANDGWGTHNTSDNNVNIKVVRGNGDFRVTGPNANASWTPGQPYEVTWTLGNTLVPADSIMTGYVNIYLSLDGGLSFPVILATNVPNTGSFNITAPDYFSNNARLKVKAVGSIYFDISKADFKVLGNPANSIKGTDVANSVAVFPNPTSGMLNIKNNNYDGEAMDLVLLNILGQEVWKGNMQSQTTINTATFSKGTYYLYLKGTKSAKYGVKKVSVQ